LRVVTALAKWVLGGACFVVAALVSIVVHLNVPAERRLVARVASRALSSVLSGTVAIEHIGQLTSRGIHGARARVRDPDGTEVLFVDGLRVDVCLLCTIRSLFKDGEVVVDATHIEVRHAWVHGKSPGLVDAEFNGLAGSFHYSEELIVAQIDRLDMQSRALPRGANPNGRIAGHMRLLMAALPCVEPEIHGSRSASFESHGLRAQRSATSAPRPWIFNHSATWLRCNHDAARIEADGSFDGTLFGAPATLRATMSEMHMDAVLDARDDEGDDLRRALPELGLRAPTSVHAELHGEWPRASMAVHAAVGTAHMDANVAMDIASTSFEGRAEASGQRISYGKGAVDEIHIRAQAHGTLAVPSIEIDVHTRGARWGAFRTESMKVRGKIGKHQDTIVVHDPRIELVRNGQLATVIADRVAIQSQRLAIEHATVHGIGAPVYADVVRTPREVKAKVVAKGIDLGRAAAFVGRERDVHTGTLTIDSNMLFRGKHSQGEVHAKVRNLSAFRVRDAHLDVDAKAIDRTITLDLDGSIGSTGHIALHTTRLSVSGDPAKLSSWRGATGRAQFDAAIDMQKAIALWQPRTRRTQKTSQVGGWLVVRAALSRDSQSAPLDGRLSVRTQGLAVSSITPPEAILGTVEVRHAPGFHMSGIDVGLDASIDGMSNDGELAVRLTDRHTALAALDIKAIAPYREFLHNPKAAWKKLQAAAVSAALIVPERALDTLPSVFGTGAMAGAVGGDLRVWGTAGEPHVELTAHARGVRSKYAPLSMATDTEIAFAYDGTTANIGVDVKRRDRQIAQLTSRVDVEAKDLAAEGSALAKASANATSVGQAFAKLPWKGNTKIRLDRFPLELVGPLADARLHGNVSGEVAAFGLHDDPRLTAHLSLDSLRIGRADYQIGTIAIDADRNNFALTAHMQQADGFADVRAHSGLVWERGLVPTLNSRQRFEARFVASAFQIAAALPFASDLFNDLDGRIDADATITMDPSTKSTTMTGHAALRDGSMQLAIIGETFDNVRATLTFAPDGNLHIDDIEADHGGGQVHGNAVIHFDGLLLQNATINAAIPKKKPINFAFQGQPIGDIWGNAKVDVYHARDNGKTTLSASVPNLHIKLPQTMKGGVEEFRKNEKIKVGVYSSPNELLELRLDQKDLQQKAPSTPVDVDVALGEITLDRGTEVHVVLTGQPHITFAETMRVTGTINVKSGKINVQGKEFRVEQGKVIFQPENPSNPTVVASAVWTATDGTKVFADFRGPLKTGQVSLRSEPARPKNEVLSLVLFGGPENDQTGSPSSGGEQQNGSAAAAATVGGAIAAQGLTAAFDDLTGIHTTARVATTKDNNPRPEVDVQLSRAFTLRLAHVIGTPPVTDPDTNLATVDWRFRMNWAVEMTFGDHGKAVADAVWQKRY